MSDEYEKWIKENESGFISWLIGKIKPLGNVVKVERKEDDEIYVTFKVTL